MSVWVVNTSPLVFLGNLGRLELLHQPGREVYVPPAVAEEVAARPDSAAQAVRVACATWMQVREVGEPTERYSIMLASFIITLRPDADLTLPGLGGIGARLRSLPPPHLPLSKGGTGRTSGLFALILALMAEQGMVECCVETHCTKLCQVVCCASKFGDTALA